MPHIYIAAAHKSSGKTSVSIGLTAALTAKGYKVQPYKKGPDYIDPIWLAKAAGTPCYNLDFNTHNHQEIQSTFTQHLIDNDIAIIEGNKGLFDGVALNGTDSNAAMAKLLKTPVILTIDCVGITRGIAPLLQGYQNFDSDIIIAGVILNKVGTSRHQKKLIAAVEHYTDIPVLGVIGFDESLKIPERHLGLIPANESAEANQVIHNLSEAIQDGVDLDKIMNIGTASKTSFLKQTKIAQQVETKPKVRVAIAQDAAFGFYYADDLEAFAHAGAELITFDSLKDKLLPEADGLFIGGGFPETQMAKLSANKSLLADIKNKVLTGLPTYAECGGLMYLAKTITWRSETQTMVGVIEGNINMHKRPQGRGYVKLASRYLSPWQSSKAELKSAHEFHYASLDDLPKDQQFAYDVKRGMGINGLYDGVVIKNLLASFSHQRNSVLNPWVEQFVSFIRKTAKA